MPIGISKHPLNDISQVYVGSISEGRLASLEKASVLAASETASYRLMVNNSDEVIYINLGGTAAANTGIRLNASGGSYEMSVAGGNWFNGAITAICASGSKILLVTQGSA